MNTTHDSGTGRPIRVSTLLAALPRGVALDALRDFVISKSRPDPDRRWASSGELGTVGDRIVDLSGLAGELSRLAKREAERVARLHTAAARAIEALQRGDAEEAYSRFIEQGEAEEGDGRTAEAEGWYLSAYGMARDAGIDRAPTALRLAARTARTMGHLESASERYEIAWREAEAMGSDEDRIVAATGRGNVAVDQGQWAEALDWYERGLSLLGISQTPRRERWQLLQNLAIVHRRSGRLKEAREFLSRAEKEAERMADPDAAVEIGNGWGQLVLAEGDPRGAELFFRRALEGASTSRARVTIQVNLGEALLLQRRALESGECAREAEAEAIGGSVIAKLPEVYRLLAAVVRARGENDAFVFLEQALALIRERRLPRFEEALTLEALGELHMAEGETERGTEELERASEIYRGIGMSEASERLRRERGNQ
jgi:tetratricopeptide (TPR) repeat protein